jgi:hypothetical protein
MIAAGLILTQVHIYGGTISQDNGLRVRHRRVRPDVLRFRDEAL